MDSSSTDPLIFPMAHFLGELYSSDSKTSTYELRGGWHTESLTRQERDVWVLAHGLIDKLNDGVRWTRATLLEGARLVVGNEADSIVEDLLERDVLMEATPGTKQAIDFAKEIRLIPLRLGGGNNAEEPWLWRIGMPTAIISVSYTVYNTWEWSHMYVNLWESCKALAKINAENPEVPAKSEKCDPEAILTELLDSTHALLSTSCVYLDVPFEWGKA